MTLFGMGSIRAGSRSTSGECGIIGLAGRRGGDRRGEQDMTIWFIVEKNGKHEIYSQLADGLSMKIYTARTRESAEAKLNRMGVDESPAPEIIKMRRIERGPVLHTFMKAVSA